jgi:hypothetical protein
MPPPKPKIYMCQDCAVPPVVIPADPTSNLQEPSYNCPVCGFGVFSLTQWNSQQHRTRRAHIYDLAEAALEGGANAENAVDRAVDTYSRLFDDTREQVFDIFPQFAAFKEPKPPVTPAPGGPDRPSQGVVQ